MDTDKEASEQLVLPICRSDEHFFQLFRALSLQPLSFCVKETILKLPSRINFFPFSVSRKSPLRPLTLDGRACLPCPWSIDSTRPRPEGTGRGEGDNRCSSPPKMWKQITTSNGSDFPKKSKTFLTLMNTVLEPVNSR
jgi:hypothetical protein